MSSFIHVCSGRGYKNNVTFFNFHSIRDQGSELCSPEPVHAGEGAIGRRTVEVVTAEGMERRKGKRERERERSGDKKEREVGTRKREKWGQERERSGEN